jgi:hypothetical protein
MCKLYLFIFLFLFNVTFPTLQAQNFESSNLPIVVINTEGKTIVDDPKVNVKMGIIDNGAGNRNYYKNPLNNNLPDPFNSFNGTVGIEHRGSASQFFPKKPYGFETRDGTDKSIKAPILGMPAESDWILNASYTDKTLMRDVLTYHLSNQMGLYATRTKFVELVLDGDYRGVYIMMEKIKRDANRVDIASLKTTDNSGDALTGGYILKVDKNTGTSNASWKSPYAANHNMEINVMVEYPKKEVLTDAQYNYIKNHFTAFEDALKSPNFKDPTNGYAKYIDVNTFIDYFLLTELTYNIDAFRLSIFFYKDRDSRNPKIKMGPAWDYDHAYGNANFCRGWENNHWAYDFIREFCPSEDKQVPFWWARLLEDRDFCIKVRDRWQQLRQNQWSTSNINTFVDQNVALLNESQTRNFQRWPILGEWVWPNYYYGNTYQEEINWFKNWTQQRLNWIDANIAQIGALGKETDCANVAKPAVTSPVNYCQNQISTSLSATGADLKWYSFQTDGVGSSNAPTPSTISLGTTSYFVSQTINGCESERAQIEVNVNSKPNAPSANNVEYCHGQTASPLSATGTNLLWYTSPYGGMSSTVAPTPSTSSPNLLSYFVSQTLNSCESNRTQINVSVKIRPDKPQVTPNLTYCQGQVTSPLSASGTNLKWYSNASGGNAEAPPTPSTASAGLSSYFVSQTINSCESEREKIEVTVNAKPDAPSISHLEYCQAQTATPLSASGTDLKWYTLPNGGTGNTIAPTPPTSSAVLLSYFVSQTINNCESNRTQINVNVKNKPDKPQVTPNISYCQGQTAASLSAIGTELKWYATLMGGIGNTTATIPSTTSTGVFPYFVSQTISGCESERAKIDVNIKAKPIAPSTSNVEYCQAQTATPLSANGTNLKWYNNALSQNGDTNAPVPTTSTAGTLYYFVSQTINNCESDRTQIMILVKVKPDKPTANTPVNFTQGQLPTALTASGSGLKWYSAATGGVGNNVAPTLSTSTVGTSNYFVSQTINGCESERAKIEVQVNAPILKSICIEAKVFLEGAMSGKSMTTKLNQQGLLPGQTPVNPLAIPTVTGQPYKTAPWNYNGDEVLDGYTNDIVDWVLISLRTAPQEAPTTIYKTAALLRKDGTISTMWGCPTLNPTQSFFVAVEHRNHIGAVSHDAIPVVNNRITYDFTQQQSYIPTGLPASGQLQVGSFFCLFASDASKASFSEINANDASLWANDNGKFGIYKTSDFNLDGEVNANDASIWRRNNGKFSGVQF